MVEDQKEKVPLLLNVFIQTVIDTVPFCYRTEKVEFQESGIYFTCLDTNSNYMFNYTDVLEIVPAEL